MVEESPGPDRGPDPEESPSPLPSDVPGRAEDNDSPAGTPVRVDAGAVDDGVPASDAAPGAAAEAATVAGVFPASAESATPAHLRPTWRSRRRTRKAGHSTLRRRLTRSFLALVTVIVLIIGGTVGYAFYRFGQIHRIAPGKSVVQAKPGAPENILLIGSTNRCAAKHIAVFQSECQAGVNGINSDVVMVLRIVPATHRLTILSIPRDTFVPNARLGGLYNKIDAALVNGPAQLAAAITQDYGIPINHFVELDFGSFENVVNALGGINMYFPARVYDAENPPLIINRTGCVHLNGNVALALVRSRHLYYFVKRQKPNYTAISAASAGGYYYTPNSGGSYDGSGDLGRIVRVHEFLRVLGSAVAKSGIGNVFRDNALIGAIAPFLTIDSTLGNGEMISLGLQLKDANLGTAPELTTPIVNNAATYYYKGYNYGDVVFPTEPQDQATINEFMGSKPPGLKLAPASITVSVVDGTNSPSATAATSSALGALGYRMIPTTATNYVGAVSETTVLYGPGHLQQAERVKASLRGTVILGMGTPSAGADVSVIAGSDLLVHGTPQKPNTTTSTSAGNTTSTSVGATTSSTVAAATTTTVAGTTTSTTNPNFGAPTAASSALPFYDPRACPA